MLVENLKKRDLCDCRIWKFKEDEMCKHFEKKIKARKQIRSKRNVESMWKNMKKCLVVVSDEVCGIKKWSSMPQKILVVE